MAERSRRPAAPRRPPLVVLLALLALTGMVAACSSIPTSGPVRAGRDLRLEREDSAVRLIGQAPAHGAKPEAIVRGFLQASADFAADHRIARRYLAPSVRGRWEPDAGTTVYDRSDLVVSGLADNGTVLLHATGVARVDADGSYRRVEPGSRVERAFKMTKVKGEWRIAALDDGLLLTASDVQETYRHLNLYFLAPSRTVLAPDPVLLPAVPGLATKMVTRLLRGPTADLRGAVTTAFPQGTGLEVSSVPVRDGVATVNLDETVLQANDEARGRLSAQLVWTLKQLLEVEAVRILASGEPLAVSGVSSEQPRDSWPSFDPAGLPPGAQPFVARNGTIGRFVDDEFVPVPGPAGDGRLPLIRPAVSLQGDRLAGVSPDGRRVLVGGLTTNATFAVRARGRAFAPPSWDPTGNLWVVDRATGRVLVVPAGESRTVPIALPRLPAGPVTRLRVARDGTRVTVVAGRGEQARLYVGVVLRDDPERASARIAGLREVLPGLRAVSDVAWADAATLAVLARQDGGPLSPLLTDSDGYLQTPVEPQPGPVTIAAAPPLRPLVVGTGSGRLLEFTATEGWHSLGPGTDPAYPG